MSESAEKLKRCVYFTGYFTEVSAKEFIKSIFDLELNDPTKDIVVIVDSYGGLVDSMFSMIDTMNMIQCKVHTIVVGKAMSAGASILMNGAKGKRYATVNSNVMIHQMSSGSEGKTSTILNDARELKRLQNQLSKFIVKKTKIKKGQLRKFFNEDFYMTPKECLKYGIVDKVIKSFSELNLKNW